MSIIKLSSIRKSSKYPVKSTRLSSCWDLFSAERIEIEPFSTAIVPTGLVVCMPDNFEMQIRSRSGMSSKGVWVANAPGIIDADYTPLPNDNPFDFEIKVILFNSTKNTFEVEVGDKIAQAAFCLVPKYGLLQIENYKDIDKSLCFEGMLGDYYIVENNSSVKFCEIKNDRRKGGLGSTGIK